MRQVRALALTVLLAVAASYAAIIPVGSGDHRAIVVINWSDGGVQDFDLAFSSESIAGMEAFDLIEAETTLTTVRQDFGWGVFIDGISFRGHSDVGYGGGEDWWHYYVRDAGEPAWTTPSYGVADRTLTDGDADGWVYGSVDPPHVPEPAAGTLLAVAAAAVLRRRSIRRPARDGRA